MEAYETSLQNELVDACSTHIETLRGTIGLQNVKVSGRCGGLTTAHIKT